MYLPTLPPFQQVMPVLPNAHTLGQQGIPPLFTEYIKKVFHRDPGSQPDTAQTNTASG